MPYLLSTPAILMVLALLAFPVGYSVWQSLYRADFIGGVKEFVGLENYLDLFTDADFIWAMNRSAVILFGALVLGISLALVFAFALNRAGNRLRFLRGLTIVPYVVSGVAAAVMFRLLFSDFGHINRVLGFFGLPGLDWLLDPYLAVAVVIFATVWMDLPLAVLLILGGLQTIDPTLLDAASMDGYGRWRTAWYISIPLITPQLVIATIWFSYSSLTGLGLILALTSGGPLDATRTMPVHLYETAFVDLRREEAMAVVVVVLVVNAMLTLFYRALFRRRLEMVA